MTDPTLVDARLQPVRAPHWVRWADDGTVAAAGVRSPSGPVIETGRHWVDVVHVEDRDRIRTEWRQRLATDDVFESLARLQVGRDHRWFRIASWPDPAGGVACALTDVHDVVQALSGVAATVDELQADLGVAQRRAAAWEAIARGVVHDLVPPLAAIRAAMTGAASAPGSASLADALEALERVIDELVVDRMDPAGEPVRRVPVWLPRLVASVTERLDLAGRPLDVSAVDAAEVEVDPGLVAHLLENLVRNAVRHTPPGTSVVIRAEATDVGVRFSVEDDGRGVPPGARSTLFQAGVRATGIDGDGSGAGLAIVARIAAAHGGGAWLESHDDGRTVFHAYVPGGTDRDI